MAEDWHSKWQNCQKQMKCIIWWQQCEYDVPRTGPTHGVQPAANAKPNRNDVG